MIPIRRVLRSYYTSGPFTSSLITAAYAPDALPLSAKGPRVVASSPLLSAPGLGLVSSHSRGVGRAAVPMSCFLGRQEINRQGNDPSSPLLNLPAFA